MASGTYAVLIAVSFWGDAETSFEAPVDFHRLLLVGLHERGFCGIPASKVDVEVPLIFSMWIAFWLTEPPPGKSQRTED